MQLPKQSFQADSDGHPDACHGRVWGFETNPAFETMQHRSPYFLHRSRDKTEMPQDRNEGCLQQAC